MHRLPDRPERPRRSTRLTIALYCALGLVNVGARAVDSPAAAGKPATRTVVIDGLKYVPEALTVKRGDTVVWVNKDPFPHTVTSPGAFDSHDIAPGKRWQYAPRHLGDYAYTCTLHPNMKATLHVE
jgi:plastocyanin